MFTRPLTRYCVTAPHVPLGDVGISPARGRTAAASASASEQADQAHEWRHLGTMLTLPRSEPRDVVPAELGAGLARRLAVGHQTRSTMSQHLHPSSEGVSTRFGPAIRQLGPSRHSCRPGGSPRQQCGFFRIARLRPRTIPAANRPEWRERRWRYPCNRVQRSCVTGFSAQVSSSTTHDRPD